MATKTTYIRHHRRNRQTGTVIEVLDAQHPDSEWTVEEGYRWVVLCTEHGQSLAVNSLRAAEEGYATEPDSWCSGCRRTKQHRAKTKR